MIAKPNDWQSILLALLIFFSPTEFATILVVAILSPIPNAMITKYIGNVCPIAAKAVSAISLTANIESTN